MCAVSKLMPSGEAGRGTGNMMLLMGCMCFGGGSKWKTEKKHFMFTFKEIRAGT